MRFGFAAGVLGLILAASSFGAPALAEPALWRVRDADTEMVLFGSIHILPDGLDWRSDELDAAINGADLVVFEILTPETEAEEQAMFMPFLPYLLADKPLSETVSATTFERARAAAEAQGFPIEALEMFEPWAVALMLDVQAAEGAGRTDALGVDTQIESGLADDRRTEALDTQALLEASIVALAQAGEEAGEQLLVETLDALDKGDMGEEMEAAWLAGDLDALMVEMKTMRTESPRLYQALLIDRNKAWMPALIRMMQTEGRVVVIAGAAHMVGEHGLPTLLRDAGFEVEGP